MYLSEQQVKQILNSEIFQTPVTKNITNYKMYRGKLDSTVYTVRFNLSSTAANITVDFIEKTLLNFLMGYFPLESLLLCAVSYDLLLVDPKTSNSFYIWRSNSNSVHFTPVEEGVFALNYQNIRELINHVTNINVDTLNTFFSNSNVIVRKQLAYVFTFITQ